MAALLWKAAVLLIVVLVVAGGALDLGLYLWGQVTISDWLRLHPGWFIVPTLLLLLFLALLALHLFGLPPCLGGSSR